MNRNREIAVVTELVKERRSHARAIHFIDEQHFLLGIFVKVQPRTLRLRKNKHRAKSSSKQPSSAGFADTRRTDKHNDNGTRVATVGIIGGLHLGEGTRVFEVSWHQGIVIVDFALALVGTNGIAHRVHIRTGTLARQSTEFGEVAVFFAVGGRFLGRTAGSFERSVGQPGLKPGHADHGRALEVAL